MTPRNDFFRTILFASHDSVRRRSSSDGPISTASLKMSPSLRIVALIVVLLGAVKASPTMFVDGTVVPETASTVLGRNAIKGVQRGLINYIGGGAYTGKGKCTCSGGGVESYSGCGNAGVDVFSGGTYSGSGSAMGKACADAACAAAGAGSCNLVGLVQGTTDGRTDVLAAAPKHMSYSPRFK